MNAEFHFNTRDLVDVTTMLRDYGFGNNYLHQLQ